MSIIDMINIKTGVSAGICFIFIFMTLIQIAPIKLNPWDKILTWLGNHMNADIVKRVDVIEAKLDEHIKDTERRDVVNAVYYALDLQKCRHLLCCSNLILGNDFMLSPESVATQFIAIQEASPISFHRRIYHIGYDLDRALDVYGIISIICIGLAICRLYPTYQSFFAVHENTKNLHLHLIINNITVYGDRPLSRFIDMNNMVYISDLVLAECDRLCNLNRLADANPHIIVREAFREYRNNTKWYRCS